METQTALLIIGAGIGIWMFFFKERTDWFSKAIGSFFIMCLGLSLFFLQATNNNVDMAVAVIISLAGFLNFVNYGLKVPLFNSTRND